MSHTYILYVTYIHSVCHIQNVCHTTHLLLINFFVLKFLVQPSVVVLEIVKITLLRITEGRGIKVELCQFVIESFRHIYEAQP